MSDSYRNTTEGIISKQNELNTFLKKSNISFEVNAAAEYYLDEVLLERIESGYPLLTFGKNYLLFETNYLTEPYILKDFIFRATTKGYLPVLAHPERYHFMTLAKAEDLVDRGVLLQANLLSLCGYYAKPIQRMVEKLIEKKWIHFLGSDCHNLEHATKLADAFRSKAGKKALDLPLLNYTL
jgi:tyrosine-protein phosphatase YwqE